MPHNQAISLFSQQEFVKKTRKKRKKENVYSIKVKNYSILMTGTSWFAPLMHPVIIAGKKNPCVWLQ